MRNLWSSSKLVAISAYASSASSTTPSLDGVGRVGVHPVGTCKLHQRSELLAAIRGGDAGNGKDSSRPKEEESRRRKKSQDRRKKESQHRKKKKEKKSNVDDQESKPSPPNKVNAVVEEILEHDDYYSILGVARGATEIQLKKAYRKRAVQTHPDKTNGDRRAFDRVAEAFEVLSDKTKRQMYDRFGKAGLEGASNANGAASYGDLFRNFFGQDSGAAGHRDRNQSTRYQLQVSLEDLYHGKLQSVAVAPPRRRDKQKEVQVQIPKGARSGQTILMSGEMDFFDDDAPGDIIFILSQIPHDKFTRKGDDLAMDLVISLEESLCGFQRTFRHLDGREIVIQSAAEGSAPVVIQTGDVQVLDSHGMPKEGGEAFGDLYIQFRVEMPKSKAATPLSEEELKQLRSLLSKLTGTSSKAPSNSKADVLTLRTGSTAEFGREEQRSRRDYFSQDSDFSPFGTNPFAGRAQPRTDGAFYFSRGFGGNFYGNHDFDGGSGPNEDVQCQQM